MTDSDATSGVEPRVLHMIGNAHIDPVWLWRWPEGYQEARATFWSAIERMNEYEDFVFTCNQIVLLAWVEESDPDLFEQITKRVADGRWVMAGGWWVEPDCNVPAAESFVRQGLLGQRYLREKFGVMATVGLNADPFGHNAMLPQILRKQRLTGYCFLRPGPHERTLPGSPFWWESPDGSRVMTHRIPHEYCGPRADLAHHTAKAIAQVSTGEAMVFYGVGNHGGGPTKANLDSIRRLNELGTFGRLELSSPDRYFAAQAGRDLPVWKGELQHHARGCYSAHSGIKAWSRRAENALLIAEKWSAVAAAADDVPYPAAELDRAWKQLLFNQFHDILPGSAIEASYEDARDELGEATAIARRIHNRAVQRIARNIDIPLDPSTQPVVVFNPHPWPVRGDVEVELALPVDHAEVRAESGQPVPTQRVQPAATMSDPRRQRLAFPADVPALGYRTYRFVAAGPEPLSTPLRATDTTLENEVLRVQVDPETGWLNSLLDKRTGIDLVRGAKGRHLVVAEDESDTWGHNVVSYSGPGEPFRVTRVRLLEHGPVRATIRVESEYGLSRMIEDIVLGAQADQIEIRVTLDWRETLASLKLRVPTAVNSAVATYEIPFGHLQRPADGAEQPGQTWVDVTGRIDGHNAGLSVVNEAKFGYDVRGADIGVTIARSPVYAWHDPRKLSPDEAYSYQDQGRQQFRYLVVPHAGDRAAADLVRRSAQLAQPPTALLESFHAGRLPASTSFAGIDAGSVVISAIKRAEDEGAGVIVRAYESAGAHADAHVDLPFLGRTIDARFQPFEIKTFLVPPDPEAPAQEVDLLELPATDVDPESPGR